MTTKLNLKIQHFKLKFEDQNAFLTIHDVCHTNMTFTMRGIRCIDLLKNKDRGISSEDDTDNIASKFRVRYDDEQEVSLDIVPSQLWSSESVDAFLETVYRETYNALLLKGDKGYGIVISKM